MGGREKRKPGSVYLLITILFLLVYFLLMHFLIPSDFVGDEGRHAMQGLIMKNYYDSVRHGQGGIFQSFLQDYSEKLYSTLWYSVYDPPGHAVLQGLFFLLFGASVLVARLSTVFLVFLGSLFLFFFSLKFFSARDSFFVVVLFLLFPSVSSNAHEIPEHDLYGGFFCILPRLYIIQSGAIQEFNDAAR
ncbi:MAG: hypothetical protein QS99_C0016G0048 [archaeon GW2011_AR4]|nr:MAG: hypothetical protein QS99_C0016G0048 [archaeon GW2011_AR4]